MRPLAHFEPQARCLLLCRFSDAGNRGSIQHARAAGVGKAPRQEIAVGSSAAVRRALWGLYERGHCQARFLGPVSLSSILSFDLKSPFFRPDPGRPRSAARKICQGRRNSAAQRACP